MRFYKDYCLTAFTRILEKLGVFAQAVPGINASDICASLQRFGITVPRALYTSPQRITIYHAIAFARPAMVLEHLNLVYEMGFTDLDAVDHKGVSPLAEVATMHP